MKEHRSMSKEELGVLTYAECVSLVDPSTIKPGLLFGCYSRTIVCFFGRGCPPVGFQATEEP